MADVQVTCITKPQPQSPHDHITHLGNPAAPWKWSREEVIASIDAKTNTFYVLDPRTRKRSNVGVVRVAGKAPYAAGHALQANGPKIHESLPYPPYVRTYADGDWNDNLLSLDQCPL